MLDVVRAVQFIKQMGSGRNKPLLLGCEHDSHDHLIEAVVKFSLPECGVGGLIRESIGAMLAADLNLPVPPPFLVVLEDELLAAMDMVPSEILNSIRASRKPTFGSLYMGVGASTFSPARTIAPSSEQSAAEIFAFDALVLNPDRRVGNSNLLYDGHKFVMIDHELALNCVGIGTFLNPAPWQPNGLGLLTQGNSEHVLYRGLLHSNPNLLDRLQTEWKGLSSERLQQYKTALPPEWADHDQVTEEIIQYLSDVQENLDAAFAEVRRVLQ